MFAKSEMKSSKFIYKLVYFLKDKSSIYIYGYLFNFFHVLYFLIEVGGYVTFNFYHRPFYTLTVNLKILKHSDLIKSSLKVNNVIIRYMLIQKE